MEGTAVGNRLDPNWNKSSIVQFSSGLGATDTLSVLFEQILATPATSPSSPDDRTSDSDLPTDGIAEPSDSSPDEEDYASEDAPTEVDASADEVSDTGPSLVPQAAIADTLPSETLTEVEVDETVAPLEGEASNAEPFLAETGESEVAVTTQEDVASEIPVVATSDETASVDETAGEQELDQTLVRAPQGKQASSEDDNSQHDRLPNAEPELAALAPQVEVSEEVTADDETILQTDTEIHPEQDQPSGDSNNSRRKGEEDLKWYQTEGEPLPNNLLDRPSATSTTLASAAEANQGIVESAERSDVATQPAQQPLDVAPDSSSNVSAASAAVVANTDANGRVTATSEISSSETRSNAIGEARRAGSPSPSSAKRSSSANQTNEAAKELDPLDLQQQIKLIQRISRSFNRLGPEGGQIKLRLHPPELGSLAVQVRMEGRDMAAKLSTETAAARDAIIENLPMLRGRLAEQGIEVSLFQVDVIGSQADSATGGRTGHWNFDGNGESGSRQQSQSGRNLFEPVTETVGHSTDVNGSQGWFTSRSIDVHA